MNGSKKECRAHRKHEDDQIGLEQQSLVDVTSYPYPSTIRAQDKPRGRLSEPSDEAQSKQQVENWEDEGGTV